MRLFDYGIFKAFGNLSDDEIEAYKFTFGKDKAFTGPLNYYRENVRFLFPYERLPPPPKFVPGLYLLGEKDIYISPGSGDLAKKMYEKLEFKIIEGADHFGNQNMPEATNLLMREFLKK